MSLPQLVGRVCPGSGERGSRRFEFGWVQCRVCMRKLPGDGGRATLHNRYVTTEEADE